MTEESAAAVAARLGVDVNSPAARALREIQMLDEAGVGRGYIVAAEDALGELLALECTGVREVPPSPSNRTYYSHDGETCPIHEWLVPADQPTVEEALDGGR